MREREKRATEIEGAVRLKSKDTDKKASIQTTFRELGRRRWCVQVRYVEAKMQLRALRIALSQFEWKYLEYGTTKSFNSMVKRSSSIDTGVVSFLLSKEVGSHGFL